MIKVDFRSSPGGSSVRAPSGLKEAMETAAVSSVLELMSSYGVAIQPVAGSHLPGTGLAALGMVRFTATGLNGTATLGASATILKRTNSGNTPGRDWIAEMANQYVGRFKLKLLRAGFELWSLAPVAVKGRLLVTGISQPESPPLAFVDAQGGAIAVWMELEVTGEIRTKAPPSDEAIPSEGDTILF